jgi:hypothetical protein
MQLSEENRQRVIRALERDARNQFQLASGLADAKQTQAMREESAALAELARQFATPPHVPSRRQACATY